MLLVITGISRAFDKASQKGMGDTSGIAEIIITSVLMGGIFGWIAYYIYAAAISLTGRWLNGKGNTKSILPILAYASIPVSITLLFYIPDFLIFGTENFKSDTDISNFSIAANILFYCTVIATAILYIWTVVLTVIGVAEVQKFSIGKAILNILMPVLIIFVPLLLLIFIK